MSEHLRELLDHWTDDDILTVLGSFALDSMTLEGWRHTDADEVRECLKIAVGARRLRAENARLRAALVEATDLLWQAWPGFTWGGDPEDSEELARLRALAGDAEAQGDD